MLFHLQATRQIKWVPIFRRPGSHLLRRIASSPPFPGLCVTFCLLHIIAQGPNDFPPETEELLEEGRFCCEPGKTRSGWEVEACVLICQGWPAPLTLLRGGGVAGRGSPSSLILCAPAATQLTSFPEPSRSLRWSRSCFLEKREKGLIQVVECLYANEPLLHVRSHSEGF